MTARKLTDSDKVEILKLYRETGETTSTLAVRYDVSHSTISRLLKNSLPTQEYEKLIQQKRSGRLPKDNVEIEQLVLKLPEQPAFEQPSEMIQEVPSLPSVAPPRRRRRRSSASSESEDDFLEAEVSQSLDLPDTSVTDDRELLDEGFGAEAGALREMLGEDLLGELQGDLEDEEDEEDEDDEDDDEDDDDEDDDEDDEDDEDFVDRRRLITKRPVSAKSLVQVLPLSQASFPKTCYLVVDRSAELIARPLKDFGELGQIPQEEVQEKTLPIFDNHRVARRFANRAQRVIKVPDGRMIQKTGSHLKAKGITRLLIDGQVYSLLTI